MLRQMFGKILCVISFHSWERDPSEKDIVRGTGVHIGFSSEGYQKAKRKCERPHCSAIQKVYRHGWCGAGGRGSRWKKLRPKLESYIDGLPNVFQA